MNILKIILFFILCLPSFAGIKATRSATNPATYVDADGVIQLLTLSNTVRPKHYYDITGFHQLAGWLKEDASTNYALNSYMSIDTNSNGLSDYYYTNFGTCTRPSCAIINIANAKSQKVAHTFTGSEGDWTNPLVFYTPNDSFDASAGNISATVSFYIRGAFTFTAGKDAKWLVINELKNDNSYLSTLIVRDDSTFVSDGVSATDWRRFCVSFTVTNTLCRKIMVGFWQLQNVNKPAAGDSLWIELISTQVEKKTACTSYIPTTTTAVTRNTESYKCRKFMD
jgi:hypothetical protein